MNPRAILREIGARIHALVFQAAVEGRQLDRADAEAQAVREAARAARREQHQQQQQPIGTRSRRSPFWDREPTEAEIAADARAFEESMDRLAARMEAIESLTFPTTKPAEPEPIVRVKIAKAAERSPESKPAANPKVPAYPIGIYIGGSGHSQNINDEFSGRYGDDPTTNTWRGQQLREITR